MAVSFNLVDQNELDVEVGIERVSVRELIQKHAFKEITLYTPSKPDAFKGVLQPDGIIILVDGYQVQSLDEMVGIREYPCVEVVRVVQLREE